MKNRTKERLGTGIGGGIGFTGGSGASILAISASGAVEGLSAAGISSGLAAIGGSMVGGIVVVTGGTVLMTGGVAYLGYRLVKKFWR